MTARERIARRRATARRLHGEGLGVREIARKLDVDAATISRDLRADKPTGGPPPPPKGNQRATTHGAHSTQSLAPLQAHYEEKAAERWPRIDEARRTLWARKAARAAQLAAFERERGALADHGGRVFDATNRLASWERELGRLTAEFDAEHEQAQGLPGAGVPLSFAPAAASDPAFADLFAKLADLPLEDVVADVDLARGARDVARAVTGDGETPTTGSAGTAVVDRARLAAVPPLRQLPAAPGWDGSR